MARIGALDWMHVFVDVPPDAASTTRAFWSRALGWETGPQWTQHPEFRSLIPDAGDRYVHVQEIDGEPRVHLDVVVDDLDHQVAVTVDQARGPAQRSQARHRPER